MAVKGENAIVKSGYEVTKVKIEDVFDCDEFDTLPSGDEIKKPYRIRIVDEKGDVVSDNPTRATLTARDWHKKFYTNKNGYKAFTRDHDLLAIMKVLEALNHPLFKAYKEKKEMNINGLRSIAFDAVVSSGGEGGRWINWVATFRHYNIDTPEDEGTKTETTDNTKAVADSGMADDLPWESNKK